ncbi:MAG TPA: hypothetical protein DEB40_13675 [Elusimicrobia bacterium]|nr:hypothetical protein [Elusimicrobiota bacterium]HBT62783.1 hypothetical protein [Elusimicrobiota bacterium]
MEFRIISRARKGLNVVWVSAIIGLPLSLGCPEALAVAVNGRAPLSSPIATRGKLTRPSIKNFSVSLSHPGPLVTKPIWAGAPQAPLTPIPAPAPILPTSSILAAPIAAAAVAAPDIALSAPFVQAAANAPDRPKETLKAEADELFDGSAAKEKSAALSPSPRDSLSADDAAAWSLIEGQDRIRVYFAPAPGLGHQSATLAIVRRLRDLGFQGEIEGVYFDKYWEFPHDKRDVPEKLAIIIPGFDPANKEDQKIPALGMTLRSFSRFMQGSQRVAIAATGGLDFLKHLKEAFGVAQTNFAEIFNVDVFLRLFPKGWQRYQSDAIWKNGDAEPLLVPMKEFHQFIYKLADRAAADESLAFLPSGSNKEGLKTLLAGLPGRELLPAYGLDLDFASPEAIHRLLLGLSEASPAPKPKGIVMPLLSSLDEKLAQVERLIAEPLSSKSITALSKKRKKAVLRANARLKEKLRIVSVSDPGLATALKSLKPGQILLVKTGPVPAPIFEFLFAQSTLPPTLAGRNAVSIARMLGIPFLSKYQEDLDESAKASAPEQIHSVRRLLAGRTGKGLIPVSFLYGNQYDFESLADFISAAARPQSALRQAFAAARVPADDAANDKLITALRALKNAKHPGQ